MTASKILFYFCISFIAGIFVESVIKIPQDFAWGILILGAVLIFVFLLSQKTSFVLGFCILFLVLGILRTQIFEFNLQNDKWAQFNSKEKVVLTGTVNAEPDVRDNFQKLKIKADKSTILVNAAKYPQYNYLDKVKIEGKMEAGFMSFPKIILQGQEKPNIFQKVYSGILYLKQKIRESIRRNFLPPESSILEGTVLGDNGAMSNDLKAKLNTTGLRHIIAVSGTHVVIISSIIMAGLIAIGLWRGQAFYFALIFISLYIVFTGLPASGVRAGVMGGLYLLAQKLGRQSMGSRVIAIACAGMLAINPMLLLFDAGFQLSFLAVMGLIYLEPIIKKFVKFSVISTTFSAQIFTLPLMVYNFGSISLIAPLTNLLILPIVPFLMGLGFLGSFAGFFSDALAKIFFIPCWILLFYFSKVVDIFSQPWAQKTIEDVHWAWLVFCYFCLAVLVRQLNKKISVF